MSNINQQFIAEKLDLSRATVSRCFTNHPGINPTTRAKVFALASRFGYSHQEKRAAPGRPRPPKPRALGVLICVDLPNFEHTGYANPGQELLNGLSEIARVQDLRLDLHFVRPEDLHLDHPSYAKILPSRRRRWDGVALIYPFPLSIVDELAAKYPLVSLVEQYGSKPLNCIDVDHHRGIDQLVRRLHGLGHRRIGFFNWHYPVAASWALRRYGAYVESLTSLGLSPLPADAINVDPRQALTVEAAHRRALQRSRHGVTAWICAADHQAYDLIDFLATQGLTVPDDLSITGFDGFAPPPGRVPLTTMQIPYHQIGVTGGKRLLDLLGKPFEPTQHTLLNCELRLGATVAAPRS